MPRHQLVKDNAQTPNVRAVVDWLFDRIELFGRHVGQSPRIPIGGVKIAFFGSVYMSVVRDLAFLEGLALYSALGCLVLTALLIAAALVPTDANH